MRGQASIEALLVLAAFLAFLAIWVPVSEGARGRMISHAKEVEAEAALSRIAYAAEEAYLLGNGNVREVRVEALEGMMLRVEDGSVRAGNLSALGKFRAEGTGLVAGSHVTVACCSQDGKAEITASRGSP